MKKAKDRRTEIMDAAERLFFTKGYHETKIIDVMNDIGIAKGTFYYYFQSKEEILDGIIQRIVEKDVAQAEKIIDDPNIPVFDKLFQVLLGQQPQPGGEKAGIMPYLHQPANGEIHQKTLVQSILAMVPVLARIVEQGVAEGVMDTAYPEETMAFLVAAGQIIFDRGMFQWEAEDGVKKAKAFIKLMELGLGAAENSFDFMAQILLGEENTQ